MPPTYAGFVPSEVANKDAVHSLFLDDVITGLNWQHGVATHPEQSWLQVVSLGIINQRIDDVIKRKKWGRLMDMIRGAFKDVTIRLSVYPSWYPFPVTFYFSGSGVPYLGKPMFLNQILLNRLFSRALSEAIEHHRQQASVYLFPGGISTGSLVDPPETSVLALQRLENIIILNFMDDLTDYSRMVLNWTFVEELKERIEVAGSPSILYFDFRLQDTRTTDGQKTPHFLKSMLYLVEQYLNHDLELSDSGHEIQLQLFKLTMEAMSEVGDFSGHIRKQLIVARTRLLELSKDHRIREQTDSYMIYESTQASPQLSGYQNRLEQLVKKRQLKLAQVLKDSHCLFTCLGALAQIDRMTMRQQLIRFLKSLRDALAQGRPLTRDQRTVWEQNGRDRSWLRREIDLLQQGGWGSAATLGSLSIVINQQLGIGFEFAAIVPHGPFLVIYHVFSDGHFEEVSELPEGLPIIVHDGVNH